MNELPITFRALVALCRAAIIGSAAWGGCHGAISLSVHARKNPDWQGPIDGRDGPVCLIQLVSVEAENGGPKHPEWLAYLDALEEPDKPENAVAIAAYEASNRQTLQ